MSIYELLINIYHWLTPNINKSQSIIGKMSIECLERSEGKPRDAAIVNMKYYTRIALLRSMLPRKL